MKQQLETIRKSPFLRVLLIGFIILLLQIPIGMLHGVISERQASRDEAVADITGKWGHGQAIVGPILVVPYFRHIQEPSVDGKTKTRTVTERAIFLPDELDVEADIQSETRYRGIYEVPVYRADVHLRGNFKDIDFADWDVADADILWDKASLNLLISDVRALTNTSGLEWGERSVALQPGVKFGEGSGVHVPLRRPDLESPLIPFSLELALNGSRSFSVAPSGSQTEFALKSNWPDPSFGGSWLPQDKSEIGPDGFESSWSVNLLGRNYPQRWVEGRVPQDSLYDLTMDVRFLPAIDQYRMAFRSVKYEFLFLALVFMTLWVFEVLSGLRLHAIQYLFCGVAMCLFYLLELSLSEHIGFGASYIVAAGMVCGLVVGYCRAVLQSSVRAAVIGGVLTLLYGYLYMLLVNQDFALLAGSIGLFAALAGVMYLTRNIQWSPHSATGEEPSGGSAALRQDSGSDPRT